MPLCLMPDFTCLWWAHGKEVDFCVLALSPVTLLQSVSSSGNFFVRSRVFCICGLRRY